MLMKLVPAFGSISTFRNFGPCFQFIPVKFPVVLIAPVSPIIIENIPCAFVLIILDSTYSVLPVELDAIIDNFNEIF